MRILSNYVLHSVGVAALLLTVFTNVANAAGLTVTDGWIRALPAAVPSGGYFTLHNGGKKAVTLTGASSPACGMLMLHQSENIGGMSRMGDVANIDVPAGGTVKFTPGGYHLMCMSATNAIKPGKTVPVTLKFSDGTSINSVFAVRNAAGN
jgi:periplasmic copper chaperone A